MEPRLRLTRAWKGIRTSGSSHPAGRTASPVDQRQCRGRRAGLVARWQLGGTSHPVVPGAWRSGELRRPAAQQNRSRAREVSTRVCRLASCLLFEEPIPRPAVADALPSAARKRRSTRISRAGTSSCSATVSTAWMAARPSPAGLSGDQRAAWQGALLPVPNRDDGRISDSQRRGPGGHQWHRNCHPTGGGSTTPRRINAAAT